MKLEHMILALWIICSMLSCWAFSLIVRWIADRHARKVNKLKGAYSLKSRVLAAALVVVCLLGSLTAGGGAHLLSQQTWLGGMEMSALGAVGIGMAMFAVFLAIWAFIGDRSRGRQRCPRCWYDMRDSNGLPCPECGQEINGEQELLRTRRPSWALFIAVVFLISGVTCIGLNGHFRDHGLLGFIPNGVLISMRDHVPEDWIFDNGTRHSTLRLTDRILEGNVGADARRAMATEIIDEMLIDASLRWEPRRMELLTMVQYVESDGTRKERRESEVPWQAPKLWMPEGDRIEKLYAASMLDLARLYDEDYVTDPMLELAILNRYFDVRNSTQSMSKRWLLTREFPPTDGYFSFFRLLEREHISLLRSVGSEASEILDANDSLAVYWTDDQSRVLLLAALETELGVLRTRVPSIVERYESTPKARPKYFTSIMDTAISSMEHEDRAWINSKLASWIRGDDLRRKIDAIQIVSRIYESTHGQRKRETHPDAEAFIELLLERTLDDRSELALGRRTWNIGDLTWSTIIDIDMTGEYAFPMIRDELLNPSDSTFRDSYTNFQMYDASTERLQNWIDNFGPLVDHVESRVRWIVVTTLPTTRDPVTDEQIDALLAKLVQDENSQIADEAYLKLGQRQK
jgi:hypothetical protein